MRTKLWAVTTIVLLSVSFSFAQTADEIIAEYLKAIGGKETLSTVKSIKVESDVEMMGGTSPNVTMILNGKGYRSETDMMNSKMVECYSDEGGWSINPMMGGNVVAMPEAQYKAGKEQIDLGAPFLTYKVNDEKMEFLGKEKIGDSEFFKIKHTNKDAIETIYFFDPSTYYMVRMVKKADMMGQPTEITIRMKDYTQTEYGLVMPFRTEVDFGGQFSVNVAVNKVTFNVPVDPTIFAMPDAGKTGNSK